MNQTPQNEGTSLAEEPHGYPKDIYRPTCNAKHLCWRCELVLRNPVQSYCGHRMCKECMVYLIRNNNTGEPIICKCCVDEESVSEESQLREDNIFPDNAIRREMSTLQVYCSFSGCSFTGTFKEYESHYDRCEFMPVKCTKCSTFIPKGQMAEHLEAAHSSTGVRQCPFGCEQQVDVANLNSHVSTNLARHFEEVFRRIGAVERVVQPGVGGQSTTTTTTARVASGGDVNVESKLAEVERHLREIEERVRQVPGRRGGEQGGAVGGVPPEGAAAAASSDVGELGSVADKLVIYEGVIAVLNREIEKLHIQSETMERQRRLERELMDTVDRKVKTLERSIAMKDATIAELELKVTALESTSYDGTLLWRITDFQRRRQDATSGRVTSIYSPPFYTSRTGYKMCARLYLNGDGMGKGTHISLFFVVMRGSFDALLKWPFRQKVTLMLLDQNGREHVIDAFRPDPTSSSFRRPTSEMNIASGCPLLMPLTSLDSGAHAYVKDNTAFIKIIVNLDDINS